MSFVRKRLRKIDIEAEEFLGKSEVVVEEAEEEVEPIYLIKQLVPLITFAALFCPFFLSLVSSTCFN